MTAQTKYITSIIKTFSTYLENINISPELSEKTIIKFLKFLKQKQNLDTWSITEIENFITTEKLASDTAILIKRFIKNFTPYQVDIFLHQFLSSLKNDQRSNSTIKNYRSDIAQFVSFIQVNKLEELFTQVNLKKFVNNQFSKNLKPSSVKRKLISISQFAVWAENQQLIKDVSFWISDIESLFNTQSNLKKQSKKVLPKKLKSAELVNDLLEDFLIGLEIDSHSQSTIKNYKSDIAQFVSFTDKEDLNKLITLDNIEKFIGYQQTKGLKQSSIKRKLTSISQFAIWAKKRGDLKNNIVWLQPLIHKLEAQLPHSTLLKTNNEFQDNSFGLKSHNIQLKLKTRNSNQQTNIESTTSQQQEQKEVKHWSLPIPKFIKDTNKATAQEKNSYKSRLKESLKEFASSINTKKNKILLPYFNLTMIVLFFLGIGYFGYQQFIKQAPDSLGYATTPTRPNRELSFQGRLTDTAQNPVTTATNMAFRLYDTGPGTGGTLLWNSSTCSVTPDQDGIFNVGLGDDCGSEISENVFTENSNVWLEVDVASETLTPRQSIKTVAYALNSETVQGYPISATGAATTNTILTMDSGGQVVLGEVSPTLKATTGTFAIEAQALTLQTTSGSNGDIILDPDGLGEVASTGYFSAPGATFSATYAGGTSLVLKGGPSGTANIQEWQDSTGTALSVVDENGNVGVGTTDPETTVTIRDTDAALTLSNTTVNSGDLSLLFRHSYTGNSKVGIISTATGSWDHGTLDFAINSAGDSTAVDITDSKLQISGDGTKAIGGFGVNTTPVDNKVQLAPISGTDFNLKISSALNSGTGFLNFSHAPGGTNKVAIISQAAGSWSKTTGLQFAINDASDGTEVSTADTKMIILPSGNVGIGSTSPGYKLDVVGELNLTDAIRVAGDAGTSGYLLTSSAGGANTWTNPNTITGSGWFDNTLNVLHPKDEYASVVDLALGGTSTASANIHLQSNGQAYFGGNIGVGTSNPAFNIDVYSATGGGTLGRFSSADSLGNLVEISNADGRWSMGINSNEQYVIRDISGGNIDVFRIFSGSNSIDLLNLRNNRVGVSTTNPTAKFHLTGSADEIQQIIQGNSTQTANLTEWQDSSGTVLGAVQSYGGAYFNKGESTSNLFLGNLAGQNNTVTGTGSEGTSNTFVGSGSGTNNTTGYDNSAIGAGSLISNTIGYRNNAVGHNSLSSNTIGSQNNTMGVFSLYYNTTGSNNSAMGTFSLQHNTTGHGNNAMGYVSLDYNTTGYRNSAIGDYSLFNLRPTSAAITAFADAGGGQVTVTSASHGQSNGTSVTISGTTNYNGTFSITNVTANTFEITDTFVADDATGWWGIDSEGRYSTAVGANSGSDVTTGSNNTLLGYNTGRGITTGSKNTILGANITGLSSTLSNNIILADGDGNQRINVDSSGNVGIGSTSPGYKLDVVGELNLTDAIRVAGDAGTSGYLLTSSAGGANTWTDPNSISGAGWFDNTLNVLHPKNEYASVVDLAIGGTSTGSANIHLQSNGQAYFGGNVGIGTTNPTEQLEVADNIKADQFKDRNDSGYLLDPNGTSILTNLDVRGNITKTGGDVTIPDNTNIGTGTLYIENSGNVGIGSTSPGYKLDVVGTLNASGATTLGSTLGVTGATTLSSTLNVVGAISANGDAGTSGYLLTSSAGGANTWTDPSTLGGTSLWANTLNVLHPKNEYASVVDLALGGTSTASANVNLHSNGQAYFGGNVGIGRATLNLGNLLNIYGNDTSTFPQFTVEQNSTGDAALNFLLTGNSAFSMGIDNSDGDKFKISRSQNNLNNSNALTIDSTLNIGIGSASPGYKLDVVGELNLTDAIRVAGDAGTSGYLLTSSAGGANTWTDPSTLGGGGTSLWDNTLNVFHPKDEYASVVDLAIGGTSTASADIHLVSDGSSVFNQQGNDSDFRVETSGQANALFVQGSDGAVGIGTSSPQADLDITAPSGESANMILNGDSTSHSYLQYQKGGTDKWMVGNYATGDEFRISNGSGIWAASSNQKLVIESSDEVGLFTINPDRTLEINVGAGTDGIRLSYNDSDGSALNYADLLVNSSGDLGLSPTGNVGVGTTTASNFKLEAAGNVGPSADDTYDLGSSILRWQDLYLGPASLHIGTNGNEGIVSYDTTNNYLGFDPDGDATNEVVIDDNGNVGIGTTAPGAKLQIANVPTTSYALDLATDPQGRAFQVHTTDYVYSSAGSVFVYNMGTGTGNTFIRQDAWTAGKTAAGDIVFQEQSGGNVGIGTTDPNNKLTINGVSDIISSGSTQDTTTGTYNEGLTIAGGSSNMRLVMDVSNVINGGAYLQVRHQDTAYPTNTYPLALQPIGGNVGIGTTTPSNFKLEVTGNVGPSADATYDLGSSSLKWNNIYTNNQTINGISIDDSFDYDDSIYFAPQAYFEAESTTAPTGWEWNIDGFTKVNDTTVPFSKVALSSSYNQLKSRFIPVQPGETLYGEMWARRETGATGTAGTLYYGIERYDKDKNPITSNQGTTYFVASGVTVPSNSTWTKYSAETTLPLSHTIYNGSDGGPVRYVRVRILVNYSAGTIPTNWGGVLLRRKQLYRDSGDIVFAGNIGIGDSTPSTKLDVNGDITGEKFFDKTQSAYYLDPAGGSISLLTAGNVGIGTTNPGSYKLNVQGDQILNGNIYRTAHNNGFLVGGYNNIGASSLQTNPIFTIGSSYIPATTTLSNMYGIGYTNSSSSFITNQGTNGWGMYVASDGDARIWLGAGNNNNSYFNTGGNIGIGTTTPANKLHVKGATSNDVKIRLDTTTADPAYTLTTIGQQDWSMGIDYSDAGKFKIGESITVGATTRFTIDSNGNVGINDDTPTYKLDVNGTGRFTAVNTGQGANELYDMNQNVMTTNDVTFNSIKLANGTAGTPSLQFTSDPNTGFYRKSEDLMGMVANGQEALLFNGGTGVGTMTIGNVTPNATKFLITGSDGDASHSNLDFMRVSSTGTSEAGDVFIIQRTATSVGNVGIGTATPTGKLDVYNGAVKSSGSSGGALIAVNPNNQATNVHLSWSNNISRLRYGGTGTGADNGFMIQGPGDSIKLTVRNDGGIALPDTSYSAGANRYVQIGDDAFFSDEDIANTIGVRTTSGGGWGYMKTYITNPSSRDYKTDIIPVDTQETQELLSILENMQLTRYYLKTEVAVAATNSASLPEKHLGIIAEDAPEIVSDREKRKGISSYDYASMALLGAQYSVKKLKELDNLFFTSTGDMQITGASTNSTTPLNIHENQYSITNAGKLVERIGAFKELVTAKITAGLTQTTDLVVDQTAFIANLSVNSLTIAGQTLPEYIADTITNLSINSPQDSTNSASLNNIAINNLISPIPEGTQISVATDSGSIIFKNKTNDTTATINNDGDLSLLGKLVSDQIETDVITTNTATISGTTTTDTLLSNQVEATSARIIALEAGMAELENAKITTADIVTATVSGTLYADNIYNFEETIANNLQEPSMLELLMNKFSDQSSSTSASLAELYNTIESVSYGATTSADLNLSIADLSPTQDDVVLASSSIFIEKYLKVNGAGYIADSLGVGDSLFVNNSITAGSISVGTNGSITQIANGTIQYTSPTPENQILQIQPNGQGSIELLAGLVNIDDSGLVVVNGNFEATGNVKVGNTLLTDLIKPTDFGNPLQVQVAGIDTQTQEVKESRFEIINEVGSPVATFSAQGAAKFAGKVEAAGGIGVDSQDLGSVGDLGNPNSSNGELTTDKTSGKAVVEAGTNEVKIKSQLITDKTLIYVTAVGSTNNQVIYVKSQVPEDLETLEAEGEFVVGFDNLITTDIPFNWWMVN